MMVTSPYKPQLRDHSERRRRSLLGKVHIAKKELGYKDHEYRAILLARFGKDSAAKLKDGQLVDLVEHFKSMGFKPKRKKPARVGGVKMADDATSKKMRALWISLYHLGVVRDPSEKALTAYAKRLSGGKQTGKAALQWLTESDAYKVIEGLKKMAEREADVDWSAYAFVDRSRIDAPRRRVVEAQLRLVRHLWQVPHRGGRDEVYAALAPIGGNYEFRNFNYTDEQLDQVIEALGPLVRKYRKD